MAWLQISILLLQVYWFGYMNSSLNPIIYAWKSPAFRDGYREVICNQKKHATDGKMVLN